MSYMYWFRWRSNENNPHRVGGKHYRKLPVPNTGCFKASVHYYRYPKTKQELTEISAFYHDDDMKLYKVKNRKRRNKIPTCWDDYWIYRQRSWKKYRKHQWKE